MALCPRCGTETNATIMSFYNTAMICLHCSDKEHEREDFEAARTADEEAMQRGDFNFKGIGLD